MPDFLADILSAKMPMTYEEFLRYMKNNPIYGIHGEVEELLTLSSRSIQEAYPSWQFEDPKPGDDKQLSKAEADYLRAAYSKFIDPHCDIVGKSKDYNEARQTLVETWLKRQTVQDIQGMDIAAAHDAMGLLESAIEKLGDKRISQTVSRTR